MFFSECEPCTHTHTSIHTPLAIVLWFRLGICCPTARKCYVNFLFPALPLTSHPVRAKKGSTEGFWGRMGVDGEVGNDAYV